MKPLWDLASLRVLVCGSRHWTDKAAIKKALAEISAPDQEVIVMHGAATGADTLADEAARELGFGVERYPADWERYGRRAGPTRNQAMIDVGPHVVLAFPLEGKCNRGTRDCMRKAARAGIPVFKHGKDGWYKVWRETCD
jgi:hypothetical protein